MIKQESLVHISIINDMCIITGTTCRIVNIVYMMLTNKLTLNISKAHFMVIHRAKHKKYKIVIVINNVPID